MEGAVIMEPLRGTAKILIIRKSQYIFASKEVYWHEPECEALELFRSKYLLHRSYQEDPGPNTVSSTTSAVERDKIIAYIIKLQ